MDKNKILVEIEIPLIEKKYDLFIPINKKIGTIKSLIENSLLELTDNSYEIKEDTNLYSKETGMYGIVRHPMYIITIILFLMIPLVLNSLISFFIFLIYPIIIIIRINNEEKVLEKELKGYAEYKKRVKYRLIPFIW